jgi:hypothetical protein
MLPPNPGVLDSLIRDRQKNLRTTPARRSATAGVALRVRIGHALIVAGTSLSGERVEQPARPPALHRAA